MADDRITVRSKKKEKNRDKKKSHVMEDVEEG